MIPLPTVHDAGHHDPRLVEGIVRVVRLEGGSAWLEPEQTAGCGSCAASAACGTASAQAPGIGTITSRLEARRFKLDDVPEQLHLRVGDRIVIGLDNRALIKGSLIAYALPLFTSLMGCAVGNGLYDGSDGATLLGAVVGLAVGLLGTKILASRLTARGDLAPQFLRWAQPGETCTPRD